MYSQVRNILAGLILVLFQMMESDCNLQKPATNIMKRSLAIFGPAIVAWNFHPDQFAAHAFTSFDSSFPTSVHLLKKPRISYGLEGVRAKRTAALKSMQEKGIIKIDTDDSGNQFLSLPWIPDKKLPYKSLSIKQRLINEVSAGAFGEISKDVMLHWVDTLKTRRQAQTPTNTPNNITLQLNSTTEVIIKENNFDLLAAVGGFKDLYAGFPIVALASIPQGGFFFLVKKGIVELQALYFPQCPELISATLPICLGVMAYWLFRTPAEVIKTQVQTLQQPDVKTSLDEAKSRGLGNLWKYYPVMLWLDIPFQIVNFILFGIVTEAVTVQAGLPANNILTRLLCGISCGMVAAAVTCPLDVCKTRIISRDKKLQQQLAGTEAAVTSGAKESFRMPSNDTFAFEVVDPLLQTSTPSSNILQTESSAAAAAGASAVQLLERPATINTSQSSPSAPVPEASAAPAISSNKNMIVELATIFKEEGLGTLFLGLQQRLLYTGLANGIRLTAYGTSRMDLMMRSLDDL